MAASTPMASRPSLRAGRPRRVARPLPSPLPSPPLEPPSSVLDAAPGATNKTPPGPRNKRSRPRPPSPPPSLPPLPLVDSVAVKPDVGPDPDGGRPAGKKAKWADAKQARGRPPARKPTGAPRGRPRKTAAPGPRPGTGAGAGAAAATQDNATQTASLPLRTVNGLPPPGRRARSVKQPAARKALTVDTTATATATATANEPRKLRSQIGASRFKSELSLFFPYYDEMISNEPRSPEFLTADTSLLIVDDLHARPPPPPSTPATPAEPSRPASPGRRESQLNGHDPSPVAPLASPSSPKVGQRPRHHDAQRLDFSSIEKAAGQLQHDPLHDGLYLKCHRKCERREKQLRNIEKNKAQHEKDNLERLLDGLRGHDWLKVMGISGITESEKREYEHKRDYFIHEVAALLEKFRAWKEEERRRKVERDLALQAEDAAADEQEADGGEHAAQDEEADGGGHEPLRRLDPDLNGLIDPDLSDGDPPDYSDVDAWAARQLRQEAIRASKSSLAAKLDQLPAPAPFTSFYQKPHLRQAAVGNHRRSGRSLTAFGHALPELAERAFELPPDILTEEAKIARARARRRMNRQSKG